jgi:hypothetical protein
MGVACAVDRVPLIMKMIAMLAAALAVLGFALGASAQAADNGGWNTPVYAAPPSERAEVVAARNPRMEARQQRADRAKRFGLVTAVAIGVDVAVWGPFAGLALEGSPEGPDVGVECGGDAGAGDDGDDHEQNDEDEYEDEYDWSGCGADPLWGSQWRDQTRRVWMRWSGAFAIASVLPRAIATYFIARTSRTWTPSFGGMLLGSALGSAAAGGVMMGFWASGEDSPFVGFVSLGLVPVLLPALVEAISYAASAKPKILKATPIVVRHSAIYVPPLPTVVAGARSPAMGLTLGTLYW